MRCACVDIGSNTTRLLVAEAGGEPGAEALRAVCVQRSFIGLPHGATGAAVGVERARRLATVVAAQVALAREHGARRIRVVGTAALRHCEDRDEVVAAVERAAGLAVTVLTAEEEARLAFAGATHCLAVADDLLIGVADIGGGSSELVVGTTGGGVRWSSSVPTGSGVLTAKWLPTDPPGAAEIAAAATAAAAALSGLRAPAPALAIAVGGSAMSLRRVVGDEVTRATARRALGAVVAGPSAEVARLLGLRAERVRLLPAGLLLLGEAAAVLGGRLLLGHGGLREGVVLQEVARDVPG